MRTQLEPNTRMDESEKEIAVMILYDDLAAAQWAGEVFSSIGESPENNLRFRLQPWRLDFLADPDWADVATAEAAEAELLVVSMSRPSRLPVVIEKWLRAWLNNKHGSDAAVVVLSDKKSGNALGNATRLEFLRRAATEAGVNFFSVLPPHHENLPCCPSAPPQAFSYQNPYCHWGLNE
jgi:hypothetical protein